MLACYKVILNPKYSRRLWERLEFECRFCSHIYSGCLSLQWPEQPPKTNVWTFIGAVGAALGGIRPYSESCFQSAKIQIPTSLGRCWAKVPEPFFLDLAWVAAKWKASPRSAKAAPSHPFTENHFSGDYCCDQLMKADRSMQRAKAWFSLVASRSWEGRC